MTEDYDLARSSKKLGKLYPILVDKKGNVIDGFHRQNADPEWPVVVVESVDTPVKLELARLAANFCRRQLTPTEFQNRLTFLRKTMTVDEISEITGINRVTIYRHLPQDLIDQERSREIKEGITKNVARATSLEEIQEAANQLLAKPTAHCTNPGCLKPLLEHEIRSVDGKPYCFSHAAEASVAYQNEQKRLEREEEAKKKKTTPGMIEDYEDKLGHMKVQHSSMELKIVAVLIAKGYKVTTDIPITVKEIVTIPDFNLELRNGKVVHGYIDGPVHKGKQKDKDEDLRSLLRKKEPTSLILPVTVKGDSAKEVAEKVAEIEEALKF